MPQMHAEMYALVLAGGRGERFWPLSRRARPKQCLPLLDGVSLLRQAADRLLPLVPAERVLVVTGRDMEAAVRAELPHLPAGNVLVEPQGRNTAPGIGLGATEVARRGGDDSVLLVVSSDHAIQDEAALRQALAAAGEAAAATGALVTLGIAPDRPETGYGYLALGEPAGAWAGREARRVARFVEKPDAATAARYLESGNYLWNAGMFAFTARALLAAFAAHLPRSAAALAALRADPGRLEAVWGELDATSIDYGILERSDHVLTVPCDVGWSDVGSWSAAGRLFPAIEDHRGVAAAVVSEDARGCVIYAPGKAVALLGVEGLAVVDAGDALLVMDAGRDQEVRALLAKLRAARREDLL